MPIRIKYRRTELSEGEHETLEHANAYHITGDNTVLLYASWLDPDDEPAQIGAVHPDRWESVIVIESAEA